MSNRDKNDIRDLAGKILLATPSVPSTYMSKSMVYLCFHDLNGAMGIVVNKLVPDINVYNILNKMQVNTDGIENLDIHFGGVEEMDRCFIVHSSDYMSLESIAITNNIALTVNKDVIKAVTSVGGPRKKLLCMGCCIWDSEQLENEVASSYWIPIDADEALIFGNPKTDKWSKALLKIGSGTKVFSELQGNA